MPNTATLTPSAQAESLRRVSLSERLWNAPLIPLLLFCLALSLRLWGLSFGLPHYFAGDEIYKREGALHLAETNFVHPNSQPSFLYNSLYLIFALARLLSPDWTTVQYHYLGRFWMALLGALTVVVLYRLGSIWGRRVGLLAALFLTVLPLHTACSRYIKEDIPLTLMATITILLTVLYVSKPSRLALLAAGLFAGIGFSTKYSGLLMVVPLVSAVSVSAWRTRREARAILLDLALAVLAFWAGFLLVSPIYLMHPDRFMSGFLGQWTYSNAGHHDGIVHDPWREWWIYYARTGLIPGLTWPVFLLSVAGLALMPRSREGWLVTGTALWLYLVFEHGRTKPDPFSARYLLPLIPLLCLSAAYALASSMDALKRRLPLAAAYALCALLFVLPPLVKSLLIADEALHDTRLVAGAWMEQAIPPGSKIVVTEALRDLPASTYWGRQWEVVYADTIPGLASAWRDGPPPYFVLSSFTYQRYLDHPKAVPQRTRWYRQIMGEYRLVKEFRPRWLTYGKHSPMIRIYQP